MHNKNCCGAHLVRQLREKAESELADKIDADLSPAQMKALLHELRVHQIELEMQNETLRQTQLALEEARDHYVALFEFAPVGYLSLTPAGVINEINRTGMTLLGAERKQVVEHRFAHFVVHEDRERWYLYLLDLIKHPDKKDCDLRILRAGGSSFYARLNGVGLKLTDDQLEVRITLTDISALPQMAREQVKHAAESPGDNRKTPQKIA